MREAREVNPHTDFLETSIIALPRAVLDNNWLLPARPKPFLTTNPKLFLTTKTKLFLTTKTLTNKIFDTIIFRVLTGVLTPVEVYLQKVISQNTLIL